MKVTISKGIMVAILTAILLSNETVVIENLEGRNTDMMISIKDGSSEKEGDFNY